MEKLFKGASIWAILGLLILVGCCDIPATTKEQVFTGFVRSVWCHSPSGGDCTVVFESEDKVIRSFSVVEVPPLWAGLHCQLIVEPKGDGWWDVLKSVKKLD